MPSKKQSGGGKSGDPPEVVGDATLLNGATPNARCAACSRAAPCWNWCRPPRVWACAPPASPERPTGSTWDPGNPRAGPGARLAALTAPSDLETRVLLVGNFRVKVGLVDPPRVVIRDMVRRPYPNARTRVEVLSDPGAAPRPPWRPLGARVLTL